MTGKAYGSKLTARAFSQLVYRVEHRFSGAVKFGDGTALAAEVPEALPQAPKRDAIADSRLHI